MGVEIERKFLVDKKLIKNIKFDKSAKICQGYIFSDEKKTIRVRTKDNQGFLTIKGKSFLAIRPEYEYEIPLDEALEILNNFCKYKISKTRNYLKVDEFVWEVDFFDKDNSNLILAEIELKSINDKFVIPNWITEEVTNDYRYYNNYLSREPYNFW